MYLQSAEISNFRGIRHLKINFEKDTTALIGENAWGKSSLLAVLWMLLGQGDNQLCHFAKSDLYIPIKLEEDFYGTSHSSEASSISNQVDQPQQQPTTQIPPHIKPYKVVNTKDIQRCYYSIPNPHGQGSILKIVDNPLPEKACYKTEKSSKQYLKNMRNKHKRIPHFEATGKNTKGRTRAFHQNNEKQRLIAQEKPCTPYTANNYPKRFYNYALKNFLDDSYNSKQPIKRFTKKRPSVLQKQKATNEVFDAMQAAMQAEALYEQNHPQLKEDNFIRLQRAKDILKQEQALDQSGRQKAQEDYAFFSEDIYQAKATSIVVDLIFCEGIQDNLHHVDRFAQLRTVAYEDPEDGFFKIHYRITGHEVPTADIKEQQKTSDFVTDHELLDIKGKAIPGSLEIIQDLRKLNPLLRLRDRRMFKPIAGSYLEEEGADQPELNTCLSSFFNQISEQGDLNCTQLNQGLDVLNFIASKYLTNYQSRINTAAPQRSARTARDIVSQPVSIETLHTLKASLEDKKPSRSKFLLSLLAGALMMSNQQRSMDEYAKPILILEDLEGRFHPTLLLTLWSILNTIPVQKIITTNSAELLSSMPLHDIRRLCRQFYNVRCYQLADRSLSTEDARKIAFHIRMSRPNSLFARCWILVEGETEIWMLNEIAGILGLNLACEGVKLVEFAQCGLSPLIKLAMQLGISYYVLTDGDDAGRRYAQTVQNFSGNTISDHLSVIPHLDIEHYLYVSGYADVYQKAAGLELQMRSHHRKLSKDTALKILQKEASLGSEVTLTSHKLKQLLPQEASRDDRASLIRLLHKLLHEIKMQPEGSLPPQVIKAACATRATLNAHAAAHLDELDPIEASKLDKSLTDARNAVTKPEVAPFDFSKISRHDINAYYHMAISRFQSSKKLSHRQQVAIDKLLFEQTLVLYRLGLGPEPSPEILQKAHARKFDLLDQDKTKVPAALFNYLKHNYYKQQDIKRKSKIKKAKNQQRQALLNKAEAKEPAQVSLETIQLLEEVLKELTQEYKLAKNGVPTPDPKETQRKNRRIKASDNDINKAHGALDEAALRRQGFSMDSVIDKAIHKKSKPGLAIMVIEAMQQRGKEAVPQMFQNMFMKIKRIAKNEFAI